MAVSSRRRYAGSSPGYFEAISCTASWMGISGFLISCARRRATSCQADTFCRYSTRERACASSATMRSKARPSSSSSSLPLGATRTDRSPAPTARAALCRRATRLVTRRATSQPPSGATARMARTRIRYWRRKRGSKRPYTRWICWSCSMAARRARKSWYICAGIPNTSSSARGGSPWAAGRATRMGGASRERSSFSAGASQESTTSVPTRSCARSRPSVRARSAMRAGALAAISSCTTAKLVFAIGEIGAKHIGGTR